MTSTYSLKRLLCIDKDIGFLRELENMFSNEIEVLLATSSLEALTLLNGVAIDIVISDQDLPDNSGLSLFEQILLEYPESRRVLIATDADLNNAIMALNKGIIDQIIQKPIHKNLLITVVSKLFRSSDRQEIIKRRQWEFDAFFEQSAVGISQVDLDLSFLNVNKKLTHLTGYKTEELLKMACEELLHQSYRSELQKIKRRLIKGESNFNKTELLLQQKDGDTIWVRLTLSLTAASDNHQSFFIAIWEDISEKRMAEKILIKNEERLRDISYAMADLFWEIDEHARYLFLGGKVKETLGYAPYELIGKTLFSLMPEDRRDQYTATYQEFSVTRKPIVNFEYWAVCKNSERVCLIVNAVPILDTAGDLIGYRGVAKDITEKKRSEEELHAHRDQLEQLIEYRYAELNKLSRIIEQGPLSISIINQQGEVDYINPKFSEITGFNIDDLRNQKHPLLNGTDTPLQKSQEIWEKINSGQIWQGEVISQKKNGEQLRENVTFSPIRDSQDVITFFLVFSEDASDKKEAEGVLKKQVDELDANRRAMLNMMEDLETAKSDAELATKAKSAFLANMSHEIRTPMNAVLGFISLVLEDPDINRPQHRNLMVAYTSAKSLLGLINDILDISKLESGKMELDEAPIYLPKLMNDTLQTLDVSAREKGLNLIINIDHRIPQTVIGDPSRLKQILINLIGNAIKFTEKGSINITVSPWQEKGLILFSIIDTGIGIDRDRLKTIFDPFTQADGSTSRRHGGTGLGTTISRQLVELMGGKIWVDSEVNKGSSFHFTARLIETDQAPQNLEQEPDSFRTTLKGAHRCFRILLVEDIDTNRTLAKIRLEQQGHTLFMACNGFEAIEVFQKEKIDVILMDIQMPDMDGIEATRRIRRKSAEADTHIPIIALTASVMKMDIEHYKEVGMDSVVGKPIDFNLLFSIMEKVVPRGVGELTINAPPEKPETEQLPLPNLKGINIKRALRTWQNPEAYITAIKGFADDHRHTADELSYKTMQGKISEVRRLLHALKGVAGNLSIETVATVADQISHELKLNQKGDVRELITMLSNSLHTVIDQIDHLQIENPNLPQPKKQLEPETLKSIFIPLLTAFDQYNPDAAAPFLKELGEYLEDELIDPISRQINQFNFDAARHETVELAKSLSVGLG